MGSTFPWVIILWGSPRRTWLFPVLLKNLRGNCTKTRDDKILQAKAGLGRHSRQFLKESSWGGQRPVYAAFLLSCAHGQAACVHHFHHILHLSRDALESLAAVVVGKDLATPGVWGLGWRAPQALPVLFFVSLPGCCSKRLEALPGWMKHVRPLYSAVRKDRAKNSKIKLQWRLITSVFFPFVPNYKTLECDDFISKQCTTVAAAARFQMRVPIPCSWQGHCYFQLLVCGRWPSCLLMVLKTAQLSA